MIRLCWAILLICYYCYSEGTIIITEPGESITLKCSSEECPQNNGRYPGMYLYHRFTEQNEVYFYSNHVNSKITVRSRFKGRIESNGAPMNHSITMTNLTVNDSGVYTCVYKESVDKSVECKVYTVFVRAVQVVENCSCETTPMIHPTTYPGQDDQHILVFIISICVLGMLLIVVFILLIIQRVKQKRSSKIRPRRSMQESSDVYEVMTKSDLSPVSEHSSESPYEFD
ncbi:sodium channel subunit beta-3-like [Oreochromis aureus]|uniref:sodium channel subunit beta-3-like n=1 Tax=Oreochromis aureus TaxID=47969 RepID=UPI0012BBF6D6|nr:sodium channel subunit beta-3-like [Oreochromis aureus]